MRPWLVLAAFLLGCPAAAAGLRLGQARPLVVGKGARLPLELSQDPRIKPAAAFLLGLAADDPLKAVARLRALQPELDPDAALDLLQAGSPLALQEKAPALDGALDTLHALASGASFAEQSLLFDTLKAFDLLADAYDRGGDHGSFLAVNSGLMPDKARLLSYAVGPTIVEIGPGGGANLKHLAKLKPGARLVGVEGSKQTAQALAEAAGKGLLDATVVHGNALDLGPVLSGLGIERADTFVLSAVLHEVFSYLEYDGRRFNPASVEAVLAQCLRRLNPGGRLLLRDPVEPGDGARVQRLVLSGPAREAFQVFLRKFDARSVPHTILRDNGKVLEVLLRRKDLAEFVFKLTWGPRAFPAELQEQYGAFTRAGLGKAVRRAAARAGASVSILRLPRALASYLNPSYPAHLEGLVRILEPDGSPGAWPDSTMALVVEKN